MLIMIGIVSRFPAAIYQEITNKGMGGLLLVIIEFMALFFVVVGLLP